MSVMAVDGEIVVPGERREHCPEAVTDLTEGQVAAIAAALSCYERTRFHPGPGRQARAGASNRQRAGRPDPLPRGPGAAPNCGWAPRARQRWSTPPRRTWTSATGRRRRAGNSRPEHPAPTPAW